MASWDEHLVILCWFYVKNCIFVHMTDKIRNVYSELSKLSRDQLCVMYMYTIA